MKRDNIDYIINSISFAQAFSYNFEIKSYKTELVELLKTLSQVISHIFLEHEAKQICLALDECLHNAYEHGNLKISNQEKTSFLNNECLEDEHKKREQIFGDKHIKVNLIINDNKMTISILDQGDGFKWHEFKENHDHSEKLHGRGLKIIKSAFDTLEYNEKGNQCTVTKNIPQRV